MRVLYQSRRDLPAPVSDCVDNEPSFVTIPLQFAWECTVVPVQRRILMHPHLKSCGHDLLWSQSNRDLKA
jgi:hypothetical protein